MVKRKGTKGQTMIYKYKLDFPARIEIIHGSHSLYNVLTWVTLFSLHLITRCRSG
jgi:hypothetical protein